MSQYFPKAYERFEGNINVKADLSIMQQKEISNIFHILIDIFHILIDYIKYISHTDFTSFALK